MKLKHCKLRWVTEIHDICTRKFSAGCDAIICSSADPEGGDRGSGPPPLKFVRGGVLYRGFMARRGSPTVVFTSLSSIFFLARFARQYYTNVLHLYILLSSILSMERSSFLYITLIIMKRIQLTIPCFHERASSYFSCLK